MATKESVEFIRDERGRKKKVVMSFRRYQALMEDLHDLAVLTKRRDEPAVYGIEKRRSCDRQFVSCVK
jgi:hypothetical protein